MKHVLFVQGAGEGAYDEDALLAASLAKELGPEYAIRYPAMPNEASPDDAAWSERIGEELAAIADGAILVAHSAGASVVLTALAQGELKRPVAGLFFIAAPFFGKGAWEADDFATPSDLGAKLPQGVPVHFYHGRDDEIVPFAHLAFYAKAVPEAVVRALDGRSHQLNNDLSQVAHDIKRLS